MLNLIMRQLERSLHIQVCDYIRLRYPDVIFRTDVADLKLTMAQAARLKRMQGGRRAYPDLFLAEPRGGYAGLFIELKATDIYKKDGNLKANPHVAEQAKMLSALTQRGYRAVFAIGFEQAQAVIDEYMVL